MTVEDQTNRQQGLPDAKRRADLGRLYEWLFAAAEMQNGQRPIADPVAQVRLITAANRLADQARSARQDAYQAELPYLLATRKGPGHFRIEVTREELVRLGVEVIVDPAHRYQPDCRPAPLDAAPKQPTRASRFSLSRVLATLGAAILAGGLYWALPTYRLLE